MSDGPCRPSGRELAPGSGVTRVKLKGTWEVREFQHVSIFNEHSCKIWLNEAKTLTFDLL